MHNQSGLSLARLWGLNEGPTRGPKPRLSAEDIAEHGVAVADAGGLDSVTLARVAKACGVVTTALYRYVSSKADLVELLADHALGAVPRIDADASDAVWEWVDAFSGQLRSHSWLTAIQPRGMPLGPNALGWLDLLIRILQARMSSDPAGLALQLATTVRAYTAMEFAISDDPPPGWWTEVVADRYPALAAALDGRDLTAPRADLKAALERILGG